MKSPLQTIARIALTIGAACLTATAAHATGVVAGATLPEQIVQEVTMVQQYVKQADQLVAQLQMEENSFKNLATLPMQSWGSIMGTVDQVIQLQSDMRTLGYATQNTWSQIQQQYGDPNSVLPAYGTTLAQWQDNLNHQVANTLQGYGLEAGQFKTQQSALQAVENASQTATGRMQVVQAANQIAGMQVNQLQLLRQDIMAGNAAAEHYMLNQTNETQQNGNTFQQWLKSGQNYVSGN